ncbi:MAG: membrane protein insertase YidC [Pseudomonadota bacterium]
MNQNDKMHPDDMRNLLIFGALSIVLWLSYDHFILKPKIEKMRAAQVVAEKVSQANVTDDDLREIPREDSISKGARVTIDNPAVSGSIQLQGARFDDLILKNYFNTIEKESNKVMLSPAQTKHPRYIEYGWVSQDKSIKTPDNNSLWRASGTLSEDSDLVLSWNNGQGLTFKRTISLNEDFGFTVSQEVQNQSGKAVTLFPYALVTQRGLPDDFEGRWIVHEGPTSYVGGELYDPDYKKLEKEPSHEAAAEEGWIGFVDKYWLTAIVPAQDEETTFRLQNIKSTLPNVKRRYQIDTMGSGRVVEPGQTINYESHLFVGAKKLNLLEKYEKEWNVSHFDLAVDFGLFYFLTRPFFAVLNFFFGLVGNFGVAIILFTVMLRIFLFPLANTSFKSFARMKQIGPQMQELRESYADDKQAMQQELVKLYQREKVNPMAGCLPILIQIPIFFSLFKVLSNTIEMRHAPFFGWIQDLSAPDPTSVFNLFGLIPWQPPGFMMIGAWACLMLVTMIVQRQLSPPPPDKLQARMIAFMPWMMTFILAGFAAGLVIYWTFNNLLSVIQQYVIMRRMGVEVHFFNKKKQIEQAEKEAEEAKQKAKDSIQAKKDALVEELKDKKETQPKAVSKPKPKKKTVTRKKSTKKKK